MQNTNQLNPLFIGFKTKEEAIQHRSVFGGRIFVSNNVDEVIWFSHTLTPTKILTHPIQKGLSGTLL